MDAALSPVPPLPHHPKVSHRLRWFALWWNASMSVYRNQGLARGEHVSQGLDCRRETWATRGRVVASCPGAVARLTRTGFHVGLACGVGAFQVARPSQSRRHKHVFLFLVLQLSYRIMNESCVRCGTVGSSRAATDNEQSQREGLPNLAESSKRNENNQMLAAPRPLFFPFHPHRRTLNALIDLLG
ncbi:hypothetical protein B0J13DRAFT_172303 [Dactylonectria estremocensis]|uniref:Uncharacterized protein n=1 Tax=Dactylonectria estremocensis TaxID=1079267 RepID=A0A9P9JGX4_9HYPO|nr:hypothetical protein B0J13DRAFT_172303 [Dactylonectria estremocensis]